MYLTFRTWPTKSRTHMSKVGFTGQSSSSIPVVQANSVMNTFLVFTVHSVHDLPDQEHTCLKSSSLFSHRVPFLLCRPIRSNVMNTFLVFILHSVHDLPDQEHTSKVVFTVQSSSSIPVVQANTVQCDEHIPGIYLIFGTWPTRSRTHMSKVVFTVQSWSSIPVVQANTVMNTFLVFILHSVHDLPDQEHTCLKSSSLFNHRVPFRLCRQIRSSVMNTFLVFILHSVHDLPDQEHTCLETSSLFSHRVPFRLCRPVRWWTHSWYLIYLLFGTRPTRSRTHMSKVVFTVQSSSSIPVVQAHTV
jgi:hypothetical protein